MNPRKKIPHLILATLLISGALIFTQSCKRAKNKTTYSTNTQTINSGEALFNQHCASCHSLKEDGMGPRLGGITNLIPKDSLIQFIQNPSVFIKSGNKRAVHLQNRYKTTMPPFSFLETEKITAILDFVDQQTNLHKIKPLQVKSDTLSSQNNHLVAEIKESGLVIELTDYINIPRSKNRPGDKGIATLRPHPFADGTLLVSDQIGLLYSVKNSKPSIFLNVKDGVENFIHEPGIGTGFGSFDFHPDYANNGLLYTTHTEEYLGKLAINDGAWADSIGIGLQWVISEWKQENPKAKIFKGSRREVLRFNTPTTAHGLQDMSFAPNLSKNDSDYGMLYFGIGDGGSNNIKMPELCHDIRSLLGTILRIDPKGTNSATGTYGIPPDNPFANHKDSLVRKEIWAYGFRNPHRMSWDTAHNNRHIVVDIGEANIEEINSIEKGGDYGWPIIEGNYGITTKEDLKTVYAVSDESLAAFKLPFAQYDHQDGNAVSGGFVYQGTIPELKGKYIFGDIVNGKLFYMNMGEDLTDTTIYNLSILHNGKKTNMQEITNTTRVHLRIGYDRFAGDLFILTKEDAMIRKITKAYFEENKTQ